MKKTSAANSTGSIKRALVSNTDQACLPEQRVYWKVGPDCRSFPAARVQQQAQAQQQQQQAQQAQVQSQQHLVQNLWNPAAGQPQAVPDKAGSMHSTLLMHQVRHQVAVRVVMVSLFLWLKCNDCCPGTAHD